MSFGLGDVLPKEALHQLQVAVWASAASFTVVMIANGTFRRVSGSKSAHRWPLSYSLLNTAASAAVLAMLSIDGSFDYGILVSGNTETASTQSWVYYRTMLTNPIVNVLAFSCFIVICVIPAVMRYDVQCWEYIRGMIGTFFYIAIIGRAYLSILQAETVNRSLFENWHFIVISRCVMALCGFTNLASAISRAQDVEAILREDTQKGK